MNHSQKLIENLLVAEQLIKNTLKNKGTIYWAGCGGFASMACHAAAELMGWLNIKDRPPIKSVSLSANTALITAITNDASADHIYSRQVLVMDKSDILILLSTSGRSKSLVNAVSVATTHKINTISIAPTESPLAQQSTVNLSPNTKLSTDMFQEWGLSIVHALCKLAELYYSHTETSHKTLVFTNGVFNILHAGHIYLLHQASMLGDHLIVAIDQDDEVKKNKPNKPLIPFGYRRAAIKALPFVHSTIGFSCQEELRDLIDLYQPDILVKGPDYKNKAIVGEESAKKVVIIDSPYQTSSTLMLESLI